MSNDNKGCLSLIGGAFIIGMIVLALFYLFDPSSLINVLKNLAGRL